jgi:hypothetical protein
VRVTDEHIWLVPVVGWKRPVQLTSLLAKP